MDERAVVGGVVERPQDVDGPLHAEAGAQRAERHQVVDDHPGAGPPVGADRPPQLGRLRRGVRRTVSKIRAARADQHADVRVGVERRGGRRGVPDRSEPRAVGDRHGLVVPGESLVEDLLEQRGLGAGRGGHRGPGDSG
ncbi:hypothetical protein [Actinomadura sp.]|uniref:hypothetical protein n=1 Tax=Actinomadura sp. TaxID=1989 RepID=UPI0037C559EE